MSRVRNITLNVFSQLGDISAPADLVMKLVVKSFRDTRSRSNQVLSNPLHGVPVAVS